VRSGACSLGSMALSIGDVFEIHCGDCGATLKYRVDEQPLAVFIAAPTPPVSVRPLDRQPGASFEGCPHGRDDCDGVTTALARLHDVPQYAEWRHQPEVAAWYHRLEVRRPAQ
jgi:hypothetical protein